MDDGTQTGTTAENTGAGETDAWTKWAADTDKLVEDLTAKITELYGLFDGLKEKLEALDKTVSNVEDKFDDSISGTDSAVAKLNDRVSAIENAKPVAMAKGSTRNATADDARFVRLEAALGFNSNPGEPVPGTPAAEEALDTAGDAA